MFTASYLLAKPLSIIFVSYDKELLDLTVQAFSIFSFSFLFAGYAIFASSFFTALSNGGVSAAISFLRTLVFQIVAILIFPLFWQTDGIWISTVAAEIMAVAVTAFFLKINQKKYRYWLGTSAYQRIKQVFQVKKTAAEQVGLFRRFFYWLWPIKDDSKRGIKRWTCS